jgi:hypothetical protein
MLRWFLSSNMLFSILRLRSQFEFIKIKSLTRDVHEFFLEIMLSIIRKSKLQGLYIYICSQNLLPSSITFAKKQANEHCSGPRKLPYLKLMYHAVSFYVSPFLNFPLLSSSSHSYSFPSVHITFTLSYPSITLPYPSVCMYRVFRAQADWTLTHTSHKNTEQSTIEASITTDGVTLTDPLIR